VAFVLITVFLDIVALGIMIPVFPGLVVDFVNGDTARGAAIYGLFGTAWALMQFLFSPVVGTLSDRIGRRPVILISNFGLGLDYFLMALAPNLYWLFVGRVISGITAASITTATAYVADVLPPDRRAGSFGLLGAAFGAGFVLGPALGGVLGGYDPRLPFWVAGCVSLANAVYGFFVLPESLPRERRRPFEWRRANPVGSLKLLRSNVQLFGLASVHFLYTLAHNVMPSVFVLFTSVKFGWGERMVGLTLAGFGIGNIIVQGALVRPAIARFGERRVLLSGLFFAVTGFVVYGVAPYAAMIWAGTAIFALFGLYGPAAQALMTRKVDPTQQGQLQGALSSIFGITGMIGPPIFTLAFAYSIDPARVVQYAGAPMLLAAAFVGVGLFIAWRVTRPAADPPGEKA
jgi:DHA1 family tetracycline resistance protein-like MFS transporter